MLKFLFLLPLTVRNSYGTDTVVFMFRNAIETFLYIHSTLNIIENTVIVGEIFLIKKSEF